MSTITIIPAKAGSTRLPKKNIMPLKGRPLLARTIDTARASGVCGRIMVSTESEEVAEVARRAGAEVPFMRPAHLARDPYGVADVCCFVLDELEKGGDSFDKLIILQPTSPFCLPEDIRGADALFRERDAKFLFSVVRMGHVFNALEFVDDSGLVRPRFPDMAAKKRHEVPELSRPNGAIIILDTAAFRAAGTYFGSPLHAYPMPWERSVDIDTEEDFLFAEFLLERGIIHESHY